MIQTPFTCQREGLTIKGMQYMPQNTEGCKNPAMIISHGFTGNYTSMEYYCKEFCKEGYVTFCFNFCGGGRIHEDPEVKSDGDSRDMNITSEVKDLCAVIEYVKALPFVDEKQIVLMGASQGGFVSGLTAAKYGDGIQKLIMLYPALCIPDHARRGWLGGARYDPKNVPEEIDCGKTVISRKFHEDVCHMDPFLELSGYQGQVLIIHGTEDTTVDVSYSMRAKERYEKDQCALQVVRGMTHGPNEKQMISIVASIRQFLEGRREIFAFRIIITHRNIEYIGKEKHSDIYFTGYCDGPYFQGTILPEGVDRQISEEDQRKAVRAEYTFDGIDEDGERCFLHVVNQWGGRDWKPVITTDSKRLAWLNQKDLTAVLEGDKGGLTVRIFG